MLKKIKSIFVVEDANATASKQVTPSSDREDSPSINVPSSSGTLSSAGNVTSEIPDNSGPNKFLAILAQVIEKNNQPGFDYFEFRQSLINLSKLSMDEATKYKSAYAAAQSMNVSPTALITSAQGYLQLLNDEGKKFAQAEQNQRTKVAEDRKTEMKQIAIDIKNKQDMVAKLQTEISQLSKNLEDRKTETANLAAKLESTKVAFENAMRSISGQINDDIQKMNQYLK